MSSSELVIIAIAALLLFGGKRLPQFARQAGRIVRQLRKHLEQFKREIGWNDFDDFNKMIKK